MKFITKPGGSRFVYMVPGEDGFPEITCLYIKDNCTDLLYGLLMTDDADFKEMIIQDRHYIVGQSVDQPENGAVVFKFTLEDDDMFVHDIGFGEDFSVAMDVMSRFYPSEK